MRRAIWMALAFMGTAPLVALAQQSMGQQVPATPPPAASPSGTSSLERGQDTMGAGAPGAPGQQSAGSVGTATGEPATGGAGTQGEGTAGGIGTQGTGTPTGLDSVPLQRNTPQGDQGLTGTGGAGTSDTAGAGPTYRGTSPEVVPPSPPTGGEGVGQASMPSSPEAMRREIVMLRQRVVRLESEVDALRGTGGGGTAGTGGIGPEDVEVRGPVTVAMGTFDGRVVNVTPQRIDIVDTSDGSLYRLAIIDKTKAFMAPRLNRIPVEQLAEGTRVRASFAYSSSGAEQALNIVAQPQQEQRPRQSQQEQQQ